MLIGTILIILGVPLWMIAGMIVLILNSRRVKKQPGMFPVKLRPEAKPDAEKEPKWQRKVYAQWVHDVLMVRSGLGLMKTTPYGISGVEGTAQDADPDEVKGLGEHPKVLRARLDDGSFIHVAVSKLRFDLAPERLWVVAAQDEKLNNKENAV